LPARNLLMVLALVGDSTMISGLAMGKCLGGLLLYICTQ
jgi:hypothetical protein